MNEDAVRKVLAHHAEKLGSRQALAARMEISPQYLCDILAGKRGISNQVLEYLKMERRTQYVRIKRETEPSL